MSMSMSHTHRECLWYAWGQQDAGIGRHVDVFLFATWYGQIQAAFDRKDRHSRPSIQDGWHQYLLDHAPAPDVGDIVAWACDDGTFHTAWDGVHEGPVEAIEDACYSFSVNAEPYHGPGQHAVAWPSTESAR